MGKIQQMPEALANQIAAGEVVERPASVVKELVENAIDAGSTAITVELIEAGIQRIQVIDDGEGMDEADLAKAFLPHATSKIYQLSDLFQIHSLGFRGEALASIGSVAKVRIDSMLDGAKSGHFIEIAGSQITAQGSASARKGTTITVDSLFYNTPARLKHLSSLKTELRHSLNFMQDISMSYPAIRFSLTNDGQIVFRSYGTGDLRQTIAHVYQPTVARQLIPLQAENVDFKLNGFISPPQLTRTSKYYIHWMINGRTIRSYALTDMLIRAYGRQLMIGRYPIAIIHIELDPRLVDVNVHPTKQTVRLSKETELNALLEQAVMKALAQLNPVPSAQVTELQPASHLFGHSRTAQPASDIPLEYKPKTISSNTYSQVEEHSVAYPNNIENDAAAFVPHEVKIINEKDNEQPYAQHQSKEHSANVHEAHAALQDETKVATRPQESLAGTNERPDFSSLRYVGQIHGTYLIAESHKGFYLIDQHAAQERIRYEHFMQQAVDAITQQFLLLPIVFHFTHSEMETMALILPQLEALGIELKIFGPNAYQLESYPTWLEADEVEQTVRDLTERLVREPDLTINQIKEAALIMQSCRGAIKANHYLDATQANYLIQALDGLEDPFHCPHGRPVFVEITQTTLEKLFKRIQDPHQGGIKR